MQLPEEYGHYTNTPSKAAGESCSQERTFTRELLDQTSTEVWKDTPFTGQTFTLDAWSKRMQTPQTPSRYEQHPTELPPPNYLDRFSGLESQGWKCGPNSVPAWQMESEQKIERSRGREPWTQEIKSSAASSAPISAFQAYSMEPVHQRFASASSGIYSDERNVLGSDPGSDLSSDYSDLFQASCLRFNPSHPREAREQTPLSTDYSEPQQKPLPEFVMEELKRLKLENMALRRMAQEVVRLNIGPELLQGRDADLPSTVCTQHPQLTTPHRLQRVLQGSDPTQVYKEMTRSPASQNPAVKGRDRGTSASMWAPTGQSTSPFGAKESVTPASMGIKPFRACDISAAELNRRVAMAENDPSPIPGYVQVSGSNSPAEPLAAQFRSKPLSRTSPRSSPSSTTLSPSRLETAPASTLVGMILDKRGQEASLLLQQQLKSGRSERQEEILQAICANMIPLSHDRHGNFLVQGAIEMRPDTAMHLKGAFVELTISQFGCHVVQKALDSEENVRKAVADELLGSRLDQTLTSRHSIHVWQRILESEWTRPQFREQIFASINRQLKGKWARTARQETGSIICQNIFESAQPAEKAQCMHEVLEELDECATNQWGVWVVQHIIEHGADEERRAALRGLVHSAAKLTLSQYGQKAVMSALKTGDHAFLQDYVEMMCQSSQPRRPPLIDVCLAAHGIQIVTQLLTTVDQKTRDQIISTVRRNSVFLKGSKSGMKVHQLCERARAFAGY
ncbi:uncharacterized protein MEPE_05428 [Melanopsichium pennsylvanicum]|uniref:PUM-HD domain-containing protein n=2 Tax=Melanopsichium pennsylvanicum TaxID=63383 RepID=A0AAJ4XQP5_9BASI|nr:uncharacterized protein MEPE_05428 [Melanopsichium pennsylvanicum]